MMIEMYLYCTRSKPYLYLHKGKYFVSKRLMGTPLNGKVIGDCLCANVEKIEPKEDGTYSFSYGETGLTQPELWRYGKGKPLYGFHITAKRPCVPALPMLFFCEYAPQSFRKVKFEGREVYLFSLEAKHIAMILNGLKTIEVRKRGIGAYCEQKLDWKGGNEYGTKSNRARQRLRTDKASAR